MSVTLRARNFLLALIATAALILGVMPAVLAAPAQAVASVDDPVDTDGDLDAPGEPDPTAGGDTADSEEDEAELQTLTADESDDADVSATAVGDATTVSGTVDIAGTVPDSGSATLYRVAEDDGWTEVTQVELSDGAFTLEGAEVGGTYGVAVRPRIANLQLYGETEPFTIDESHDPTTPYLVSEIAVLDGRYGLILGNVTDGAGAPSAMTVHFHRVQRNGEVRSLGRRAVPDADGDYAVRVRRGQFRVEFGDGTYYDGAATVETAQDVVVVAGQVTSGIDGTVEQSLSSFFGGIGAEDLPGNSLKYGYVTLYRVLADGRLRQTAGTRVENEDGGGQYVLAGAVPAGEYTLHGWGYYTDSYQYREGYLGGVEEAEAAERFTLPANANGYVLPTVLLNRRGGTITGTIRNSVGDPVPDAEVELHRRNSDGSWSEWDYADADANGMYRFNTGRDGDYTVGARLPGAAYDELTFLGGADESDGADVVELAGGNVVDDPATTDITLATFGRTTLTGRLVDIAGNPLADAEVYLYRRVGGEWRYMDEVYAASFSFEDLRAPGTYTFAYYGDSIAENDYLSGYFGGASTIEEADVIRIPAGAGATFPLGDVEVADPQAFVGGTISGVGGASGAFAGVTVYRIQDDGDGPEWSYWDNFYADASGVWSERLAPGEYRFAAQDNDGFVHEYYDGAASFANATTVEVGPRAQIDNIDFTVAPVREATIRGVAETADGASLARGRVTLYRLLEDGSQRWVDSVFLNDSSYSFDGISVPGRFSLHLDGRTADGVRVQGYLGDVDDLDDADTFTVPGDQAGPFTAPDLSVTVTNGLVRGAVTDLVGTRLSGMHLDVYRLRDNGSWRDISNQHTRRNGTWSRNLTAGEYRFGAYDHDDVSTERFYDGTGQTTDDIEDATSVTVEVGEVVDGIDIALDVPPKVDLAGRVLIADETPLRGGEARLYRLDPATDEWERIASDQLRDGKYDFSRKAVGRTYTVAVKSFGVTTYLGGASTLEEAERVAVPEDQAGPVTFDDILSPPTSGIVRGTITSLLGQRLSGMRINVYKLRDGDGWSRTSRAYTKRNGDWNKRLAPGDYRFSVTDRFSENAPVFYNGPGATTDSVEDATTVPVAAGDDIGDIDIAVEIDNDTGPPAVNDSPPVIQRGGTAIGTGVPQPGDELTVAPGSWTPPDVTLAHTWVVDFGDGRSTFGTGDTVTVPGWAVGGRIQVVETATTEAGASARIRSALTEPVGGGDPDVPTLYADVEPVANGLPRVGQSSSVDAGSWYVNSPDDGSRLPVDTDEIDFTYQWFLDYQPVTNGGTGATYTPAAGREGQLLTVQVTATHPGTNAGTAWVDLGRILGATEQVGELVLTALSSETPREVVANAWVSLCTPSYSTCTSGSTGVNGTVALAAPASAAGTDFIAQVYPPSSDLLETRANVRLVAGQTARVEVLFRRPSVPPAGTGLSNSPRGVPVDTDGDGDTDASYPMVYVGDPQTLTVTGAPGVAAPTWTVICPDSSSRTGNLTENPAGTYTASIPGSAFNCGGRVTVVTNVPPAGGGAPIEFTVYVDPSGHVTDQYGVSLPGATVTLERLVGGTFSPVADGDDTIMDPATAASGGLGTQNPGLTDANGFFRWDVAENNEYRVAVDADARNGTACAPYTTPGMQVPPQRINLLLKQSCPSAATPTPVTAPRVSGGYQVGSTLSAVAGTWGDDIASSAPVRWFRGSTRVGTGPTYVVQAADAGQVITARFTQQRADYLQDTDGDRSIVSFTPFSVDVNGTVAANGGGGGTPTPTAFQRSGAATIAGTAKVGSQLTATAPTWTPVPDGIAYQWFRGDVPIAGATRVTYTPVVADLGARLSVTVTATKAGYTTDIDESPAKTVGKGTLVRTGSVTVAGTARVGEELTATLPTYSPAATTTVEWLRGGSPIPGADETAYTLTAADAGRVVRVRVTATAPGYEDDVVTSAEQTVQEAALTVREPAQITGTAEVGSVLVATASFSLAATPGYQWMRDGQPIAGATSRTYQLVAADAGRVITVVVTGSLDGYEDVSSTSVNDVEVAALNSTRPKIRGKAVINRKLSATRGTWIAPGHTFAYQWRVGGRDIQGATMRTLRLTRDLVGRRLTVVVTAIREDFPEVAAVSKAVKVKKGKPRKGGKGR